ncbi:hypothetical protein [Cronobacter sakazakii]|uniref:hypothetical protein n=1 Tax=Cronobacter sakazakii TaxID=28141 RepID=UPI000A14CCE7|nr:hypothetical protein [Cronobacter sakazakii]EIZ8955904.1 hypothetical protein [Cronobacter sakazakii]ELY3575890.1 hypothetical protein [Cronobacter sakazakii]MBF4895941.1 hypothetical protein [Cronobacter sakazakii]MBF4946016.1 hypothetical protein [Cronobacter sakazakii]MDI9345739.1 hypothetical protein [Cronobacter sakazakii]
MNIEVKKAVKCWADRPTWFSPHPMDAAEFKRAVSNLKRLSPTPTFEEIKDAIMFFVSDAPTMLGTPSDIPQAAHDFAAKMYNKL